MVVQFTKVEPIDGPLSKRPLAVVINTGSMIARKPMSQWTLWKYFNQKPIEKCYWVYYPWKSWILRIKHEKTFFFICCKKQNIWVRIRYVHSIGQKLHSNSYERVLLFLYKFVHIQKGKRQNNTLWGNSSTTRKYYKTVMFDLVSAVLLLKIKSTISSAVLLFLFYNGLNLKI